MFFILLCDVIFLQGNLKEWINLDCQLSPVRQGETWWEDGSDKVVSDRTSHDCLQPQAVNSALLQHENQRSTNEWPTAHLVSRCGKWRINGQKRHRICITNKRTVVLCRQPNCGNNDKVQERWHFKQARAAKRLPRHTWQLQIHATRGLCLGVHEEHAIRETWRALTWRQIVTWHGSELAWRGQRQGSRADRDGQKGITTKLRETYLHHTLFCLLRHKRLTQAPQINDYWAVGECETRQMCTVSSVPK